jgi:elongation factor P
MISSHELKKGLTLDIEGEPYIVLEWQHVEQGRESANIRMKLRHLRTGAIIERTLDAGHKFRLVPVERHPVTFMYWDGAVYHFMSLDTGTDPDTENEIMLSPETLGNARKYIIDNLQLDLLLLNNEPVGVELPESIVMRVLETDAVVSADSHYKHARMEGPARLETGLIVLVPPFISPGDLIRVNTSTGEYMERV